MTRQTNGALWKWRAVGGGGKLSSRVMGGPSSTSSFPPPPTALGNRQLRDSHISTAPATVLPFFNQKNKTKAAPFGRSRKEIPAASRHTQFQDHLVLESNVDFSIILRLENADTVATWISLFREER
jgi:hypothetical protein